MKNSLTVIVPILNEESFLDESVKRLLQVEEINEVFLVDDCSVDNSLKIMITLKDSTAMDSLTLQESLNIQMQVIFRIIILVNSVCLLVINSMVLLLNK